MPITDFASYLPTMDAFIAHWAAVNAWLAARGEPEVLLRDGSPLPELVRARAELASLLQRVEAASERRERRRDARRWLQEELRARLAQLRDAILLSLSESPWAGWARALRLLDPADGRYLGELDAALVAWDEIDRNPSLPSVPLLLGGGYGRGDFREDVRRFRVAGREEREAVRLFRALLRTRDVTCGRVMDSLTQYRCAVRFDREMDPSLLRSLPARMPSSYRPGAPAGEHW
ncbi:MAG TPA: hypothetical protein VK689_19770 [Armatimonadota bacterium]|nr:hypothetical protein [Armatimonadota bacterium]